MTINYPLASNTWGSAEYGAIQKVVDSKMFTMGAHVEEYEKEFANFFGSQFAVMTSSGSMANLLMIASLFFTKNKKHHLKPGDEIIVPAVSWSTTFFPLQQYGLKVIFVDICEKTLNLDLGAVASAISERTRAILGVNLLGNPIDYSKLKKIIRTKNILLLEDNCESMGASVEGKMAGTFGLMGTFSSFFSHHIATMEGGCILLDDEELYHILLCLRAHGWTRNLPTINHVTGEKGVDPFEESFRFVLPGYNARPLEMSGAIGLEQLKKFPQFLESRRKNAAYFSKTFQDHPYLSTQKETGKSSWFGFSLLIDRSSKISRKHLVATLERNGIQTRPIVSGNFAKNPVLKYFDYSIHQSLNAAEHIDKKGFFVGNHHTDIKENIQFLYETTLLVKPD